MCTELVTSSELLVASWANLQTIIFVLGQFCKDEELHVTPWTRALDGFVGNHVDELDMTSQITITPTKKILLRKVPIKLSYDND